MLFTRNLCMTYSILLYGYAALTSPLDCTWVFSSTTPLDETDDEQDENQQSDGTHEPNKPALGSDVFRLLVGC